MRWNFLRSQAVEQLGDGEVDESSDCNHHQGCSNWAAPPTSRHELPCSHSLCAPVRWICSALVRGAPSALISLRCCATRGARGADASLDFGELQEALVRCACDMFAQTTAVWLPSHERYALSRADAVRAFMRVLLWDATVEHVLWECALITATKYDASSASILPGQSKAEFNLFKEVTAGAAAPHTHAAVPRSHLHAHAHLHVHVHVACGMCGMWQVHQSHDQMRALPGALVSLAGHPRAHLLWRATWRRRGRACR